MRHEHHAPEPDQDEDRNEEIEVPHNSHDAQGQDGWKLATHDQSADELPPLNVEVGTARIGRRTKDHPREGRWFARRLRHAGRIWAAAIDARSRGKQGLF